MRGISKLYLNYLNKVEGVGVIRLEPPELVCAPLKVYTRIQATGQIMLRETAGEDQTSAKAKAKAKAGTLKAKTKAKAVEESTPPESEDDQEGEEEEDDEEDAYDLVSKELALLDSAAGKKGGTGKKPTKKKSKAKKQPTKAKTEQDKDPAVIEPPSKKAKVSKE